MSGFLGVGKRSPDEEIHLTPEMREKVETFLKEFANITALMEKAEKDFEGHKAEEGRKANRVKRQQSESRVNPLMEQFVQENKEMLQNVLERENVQEIFGNDDVYVYEDANTFDSGFFETIAPFSGSTERALTSTTLRSTTGIPDLFVPVDEDEQEQQVDMPFIGGFDLPELFAPLVDSIVGVLPRRTTTTSTTTIATTPSTTTPNTANLMTKSALTTTTAATTTNAPVVATDQQENPFDIGGLTAVVLGGIGLVSAVLGSQVFLPVLRRRSDEVPFLSDLPFVGSFFDRKDDFYDLTPTRRRKRKKRRRRKRPQAIDYAYEWDYDFDGDLIDTGTKDYKDSELDDDVHSWPQMADDANPDGNVDEKADHLAYDYIEDLYPELFDYSDFDYASVGNLDLTKSDTYQRRRGGAKRRRKKGAGYIYPVAIKAKPSGLSALSALSTNLRNFLQERDEDEAFLNNVSGSFDFNAVLAVAGLWWLWNTFLVDRIPTNFISDIINGNGRRRRSAENGNFNVVFSALNRNFEDVVDSKRALSWLSQKFG